MKKIILITESYPFRYAKEDTFLVPELNQLIQKFEIEIFPLISDNDILQYDSNIKLNKSLLNLKHNPLIYFKILLNKFFIKEVLKFPKILLDFKLLRSAVVHLRQAIKIEHFFKNKYKFNSETTIFYTYWFNHSTTALCILKDNFDIKLITRAHGVDLFDFRHYKNYIPYRNTNLQNIDKVHLVSEYGNIYIKKKHFKFNQKFIINKLGIDDVNFITPNSNDDIFRILSCSNVIRIKRIELIINGLAKFNEYYPNLKIQWTHIGDGSMLESIKNLAFIKLKKNISVLFLGKLSIDHIYEYYKKNMIDVFITTTATEGGCPVSIQEALNFHVPIIATNVGAIPEIVYNGNNGILLNEEPTDIEIANTLKIFIENPNKMKEFKKNAKEVWRKNFNSIINHEKFSRELSNLI